MLHVPTPIPDRFLTGPKCRCGGDAVLVPGCVIYPGNPQMKDRPFWSCDPCNAYVGCHPGTIRALGTPADAPTRQARSDAHAAFDRLWRTSKLTRIGAYKALAEYLGITADECHMALFDVTTCLKVIDFAHNHQKARS